jgi:hypothetical protein
MDHTAREHIRKNMELIACISGFKCLDDGYEAIGMTRQFGSDLFTCVGAEPWRCQHAIHYGYSYFCMCPVFIRIAQDIKKINGVNAPGAPETEMLKAARL